MGIKERQDRERQAVRQSILDAARDLFTSEGYRNVSIRKIAERIEYSPAAIYSYFAGKDDIYLALAEDGFRLLDSKVKSALGHGSPLDEVRAGWWAFYEFSKEQPAYFELMFVDRSVPAITEGWEGFEILQALLTNATEGLQRAVDAGELPPAVNPCAAMHVLWGALVGPSVLRLCQRLAPGEDADLLARDVLDSILTGLESGHPLTFHPRECCADGPVASAVGVPVHEP
ncbi:MAG: TetR/AcrR family transcriptional regulator [Acidobacteria bacterium]|nr:TetR/AcrR family transcriptional regulator [Acidobacteriota bacterium]